MKHAFKTFLTTTLLTLPGVFASEAAASGGEGVFAGARDSISPPSTEVGTAATAVSIGLTTGGTASALTPIAGAQPNYQFLQPVIEEGFLPSNDLAFLSAASRDYEEGRHTAAAIKAGWQSNLSLLFRVASIEDTKYIGYMMESLGIRAEHINEESLCLFKDVVIPNRLNEEPLNRLKDYLTERGYEPETVYALLTRGFKIGINLVRNSAKPQNYAGYLLYATAGIYQINYEWARSIDGISDELKAETIANLELVANIALEPQLVCEAARRLINIEGFTTRVIAALQKLITMGDPEWVYRAADELSYVNGARTKAIEAFQQVVGMGDPEWAYHAAVVLSNIDGAKTKAIVALQQVVGMGDPELAYEAAVELCHIPDAKAEAIVALQQVIGIGDPELAYLAAVALSRYSANSEAIVAWQQIVTMNDAEFSPRASGELALFARAQAVSVDELVARAQEEIAARAHPTAASASAGSVGGGAGAAAN